MSCPEIVAVQSTQVRIAPGLCTADYAPFAHWHSPWCRNYPEGGYPEYTLVTGVSR